MCTVPVRDLGLGLGLGCPSDEQAQELTDDYSLPALKVMFQLFVGQSSEFFRRLALLLSLGREDTGQDARPTHRAVAEVTGPLRLALCGCLGDLQLSYDFHRCFETQHGPRGSDRAARARQQCRELNALHTSVRSLQLHLKALLNEVIILEDELEKMMVSQETVEMACAQDLQDRLRVLQPHMQASRGCWEETVAQVGRMLRRSPNRTGTLGTPEESAPQPPTPLPCPVTLNQDPVPEEQELEAYASDSDSDLDWRDLLSPEECEWKRLGREESRPVLLELKSVLGLRASEGERHKWKRLLFSDQAALRTTLPMEPSEPHRTPDLPEPHSQQNNHDDPALCSTDARFCCGNTCGSVCTGGGQQDRAPPGGQSLRAVCDRQSDGPPRHSSAVTRQHQHGGAGLHG
ncbi:hypothetical protein SKAU_G00047610 [Synaphobranchus kaupii]|uniref:Vezatin n=1 Tax=Synaphobranchus kaupii TaxID=118154 RepID=A0A9Q1G377_SYNKA|nr:hypothetical protein SKAU_G00047610 [Synaphobranchus kaupii]